MRFVTVLALLLAVVAACGQEEPVARPSEVFDTETPTRPPMEPAGTEVRGVLGGDPQLEGGCAWVETDDGTRYEVLYPEGYAIEFDPLRLVGPDGEVIAEEGDRIEVQGEVADDVATICQVGPVWRADAVEADSA